MNVTINGNEMEIVSLVLTTHKMAKQTNCTSVNMCTRLIRTLSGI